MFLPSRLLTSALCSSWMWRKRLIRPTKAQNSIYCRVHVGLISIEHQAIFVCHHRGRDVSSPIMKINYAFFLLFVFPDVSGRHRPNPPPRTGNNCYQVTQYRRNRARDHRTNRPPCGAISFAPIAIEIGQSAHHPRYSTAAHASDHEQKRNCTFRNEAQSQYQSGFATSCCALSNLRRATIVARPIATVAPYLPP